MFYHEKFTEETFDKFKAGVIAKKKSGFSGLDDEAEDLYLRMRHFTIDSFQPIVWNKLEEEIECIENYCNFERCKKFYRKLFAPQEKLTKRRVTIEDFNLFRKVSTESDGALAKDMRRRTTFEDFHNFIDQNNFTIDDAPKLIKLVSE